MSPISLNQLWKTATADYVLKLECLPNAEHLLITASNGEIILLSVKDGVAGSRFEADPLGLNASALRPDGKILVTGGQDGDVKYWSIPEGKLLSKIPSGAPWVEHLAWSRPDNPDPTYPRLACGAGKLLKVLDFEGKPVREFKAHPKTLTDLHWLGMRQLIAVSMFGGVVVWGAKDGQLHKTYEYPNPIIKMSRSPNGQWLIAATQDMGIHLWQTKTSEEMHMSGFEAKVREIAWHSSSQWLATGGGSGIALWDCSGPGPAGRKPQQLLWHRARVSFLSWQTAGDLLASGATDGGVALWRLNNPQPVSTAKLENEITALAWSGAGDILAIGDSAGGVYLYSVG
jgi:WD40 repeat protein